MHIISTLNEIRDRPLIDDDELQRKAYEFETRYMLEELCKRIAIVIVNNRKGKEH